MTDLTAAQQANIQAVRDLYDAINRNDIPGVLAPLDPEIVWYEPETWGSGANHGVDAVATLIANGRGNWAEGTCEPEQIYARGDKIMAVLRIHVRVKDQRDWINASHAAVFTFRDGKAVEQRIIDDIDEAFAYAGLTSADLVN